MKVVIVIFIGFLSQSLYASDSSSYSKDFLRCTKVFKGTFSGPMNFRNQAETSITLQSAIIAKTDPKTGILNKGPVFIGTLRVCVTEGCFKNNPKNEINTMVFPVLGESCGVDPATGEPVIEVHNSSPQGNFLSVILEATKDGLSAETSLSSSKSNLTRR